VLKLVDLSTELTLVHLSISAGKTTMRGLAVVLFAALLALQSHHALGREIPEARRLLSEGSTFNYRKGGLDWAEKFPDCGGSQQSPINIEMKKVETNAFDMAARFVTFGIASGAKVENTGQAVKVSWEEVQRTGVLLPVVEGKVSAAVDPLNPDHDDDIDVPENGTRAFQFANVEVLQFHFHISSENAIDGVLYPLEAHLVTRVPDWEIPSCGKSGCIVVFAMLYRLGEEYNFFLEPFFDAAPVRAGEKHAAPLPDGFTIDFDEFIPEKKSYWTWDGSFTTPPCTEGVTWILFDTIGTIAQRQLSLLQSKMAAVRETCQADAEKDGTSTYAELKACNNIGDLKNNRAIQPMNTRTVHYIGVRSPASR
jgi:carbonic anhydrase